MLNCLKYLAGLFLLCSANDSIFPVNCVCSVTKNKKKQKKKQKKKKQHCITQLMYNPLSSGKAPGSDAISAEIYKAGGLPVAEKLTELFHIMWRKEPSLKNSRMQQLATYSKGKGILKSVTIIEASLYCQLLGRS